MTNKINGIDVSECDLYCSRGYCMDDNISPVDCKDRPDCEYKQLKRLQEENKRLQMLSCANCGEKYLSPDGAELYEKNVQLQKENEELKNRLKTLDEEEFVYEVTEIEYNNFKKMNKYKQALEEIREITNECITDCMGSKCEGMEEIQKLIKEVLK